MSKTQAKEHRSKHLKAQENKKRVYIIALVIVTIIGILFLTAGKPVPITDYDKISQGGIVQVAYGEYVEDGYYYDFTGEEINELKEILSTAEMTEIVPFSDPSMIYYLVHLYDNESNPLFGLYMSMDGKIYYNNNYVINTDEVGNFLNRYVLYSLVDEEYLEVTDEITSETAEDTESTVTETEVGEVEITTETTSETTENKQ